MDAVAGIVPSAHVGSARAAQEYIEDEAKVDRRYGHANSFGTIGATYEERIRFWDLVNEHERAPDARTQTRLVLELPHEASAEARQEIVRTYCAWFEERGVPYWAAIHNPTKDNDSRNYHAHIVHTDRPARQMAHPETGETVWDFTIKIQKRDKTRHVRTSYAYRQKQLEEMRAWGYVKQSRARFATVANEVLERHKCKVRYDPRSYKDMGLDVEPMRNVSRIVADKMKSRDFVAMDAEWTRKMVEQEMAAAALARDKTLQRLQKVEKQLREATKQIRQPAAANAKLPRNMQVGRDSTLTETAADAIVTHILRNERDRLAEKFVRETTRRAIVHVVQATSPKTARRQGGARKAYDKANETPDPEAMAALHEAATLELKEFDQATARWRAVTAIVAQRAYDLWQRSANPSRYKPRVVPPPLLPTQPEDAKPPAMPTVPDMPTFVGSDAGRDTTPSLQVPPLPPLAAEPGAPQPPVDLTRANPMGLVTGQTVPSIPAIEAWRQEEPPPIRHPLPPVMDQQEPAAPKQRTPQGLPLLPHEEMMEKLMGPPGSLLRRAKEFVDGHTRQLIRLVEDGTFPVLDEKTVQAYLDAVFADRRQMLEALRNRQGATAASEQPAPTRAAPVADRQNPAPAESLAGKPLEANAEPARARPATPAPPEPAASAPTGRPEAASKADQAPAATTPTASRASTSAQTPARFPPPPRATTPESNPSGRTRPSAPARPADTRPKPPEASTPSQRPPPPFQRPPPPTERTSPSAARTSLPERAVSSERPSPPIARPDPPRWTETAGPTVTARTPRRDPEAGVIIPRQPEPPAPSPQAGIPTAAPSEPAPTRTGKTALPLAPQAEPAAPPRPPARIRKQMRDAERQRPVPQEEERGLFAPGVLEEIQAGKRKRDEAAAKAEAANGTPSSPQAAPTTADDVAHKKEFARKEAEKRERRRRALLAQRQKQGRGR